MSIKVTDNFLSTIKNVLSKSFKNKRSVYNIIFNKVKISFSTFCDFLEEGHNKKYHSSLNVWLVLCKVLNIKFESLQENVISYKTSNGSNYISNPILPVEITPIFDMILAHNIGDGTVINPKNGRLPYFGYRQYDLFFRESYITKLESVFGKINFPEKYYLKTTRPYCPPILASLFFSYYNLNEKSFLSKEARIPPEIFSKSKDHLLGILIAFIIDEGHVDSTLIVIGLKNINLINDLAKICRLLNYNPTVTYKSDYGFISILRDDMKKFWNDYNEIVKKYPRMSLGKIEKKIQDSFKIYDRPIYKTKGNREIILNTLIKENLTVNQIAEKINMTRQGVRYHINILEKMDLIEKNGFIGEGNIIYTFRRRWRCLSVYFGKPSVGKSSFFKAATLAETEIANYPFTTLKSQEGIAYVKVDCADNDFNIKCTPRFGYCINGKRFVPIKLTDIPGLIEGSHTGAGRGNEFLSSIASADALIHIIDISGSTNEKGEAVKPLSHDPLKDVKFLEHELDMWYFGIMKKGWEKFARTVQQENQNIKKAVAKQLSGLRVTEEIVEKAIKKLGLSHHPIEWNEHNLRDLSAELRKSTKPMIIAANKIDIPGSKLNLDRLKESFPDYIIFPSSADSELALREAAKHKLIEYIPGENSFKLISDKLTKEQKDALDYIKKNVLDAYGSTGIQNILDYVVFNLLKYLAIFPGGVNNFKDSEGRTMPDCYLLPESSTAIDFAFRLHTDLGNNFIKAIDVRTKRVIGREYKLKNRDIIEIVTRK